MDTTPIISIRGLRMEFPGKRMLDRLAYDASSETMNFSKQPGWR